VKKKYLVTGAAGFIGAAIAKKLVNENFEVWTIDNLSTGVDTNLPGQIKFIEGNCQDDKCIEQLRNTKFDAILHFAGQSSGEISFDDPIYDLRTNCESTLKLIQYGLLNGCNRFIYSSSMSVYGEVQDTPVSETSTCKPLSFYGIGKLASENYLRIYQSKGLQPTSLRLFNVYGPGQNLLNLRQGMVSIYLAQLLKNNKINVKGSPARYRDFIYIDDVVEITLKLLLEGKSIGKIYNVGTGIKTTVQEILDNLIKLHDKKVSVNFLGPTPGDQLGITADISLLSSDLRVNDLIKPDEGIKKMMDWAKNDKY
jgi:UDP-glucose 4-epimerase